MGREFISKDGDKIALVQGKDSSEDQYIYWCPGCKSHHLVNTGSAHVVRWGFNNNRKSPTFTPSVRHSNSSGTTCHYFVRNGNIEFCHDSKHALAGKTVPMQDIKKTL